MIAINNVKLSPDESKDLLLVKACRKLRLDTKSIKNWKILKQSLDARKKGNIFFIYTVLVETDNDGRVLRQIKDKDVSKYIAEKDDEYECLECPVRPVVVGFGPGGMFAALTLAQMGLKPIVLERGKSVEERTADVEKFWKTGLLNTNSNVQFGEGGAGTFSDGKLTARSKDAKSRKVFKEFVNNGAPEEILYVHNPHIGTDKLRDVVKNIRETIKNLGGEVRFNSKVTDMGVNDGRIEFVTVNGGEKIACNNVVLAVGHSARDTLEMLYAKGAKLSQKPFAVGVRIEHLQKNIDIAQFGDYAGNENLGPAEYQLTYRAEDGRSVYTFCMCPGGEVVAAASEEGMVCVNGMSSYKRDGVNANSALLVQINTDDYGSDHPLAGMYFQRELEKKAFEAGGANYNAPAQKLGDFIANQKSTSLGTVDKTYQSNVTLCNLNDILPKFMTNAMKAAVVHMGKRLKGFDDNDALLTALESRSSSPVRMDRDIQTCESLWAKGLYPVGEGAGYAGGIVSSAVDGIRVAEKIYEDIKNNN